MTEVVDGTKTRKLVLQAAFGALVGAAVTYLFFELGEGAVDLDDPVRVTAAASGIVYALIGLFVAVGALVPGAGAKFLNVEDADELVEERAKIGPGALGCLLMGLLLIVLALMPGGLSRDAAAGVSAVCFAGLAAIHFWMRGRVDEFNQSLSREASALAMHCSLVFLGGWAALAHLGYVEWIAPLGLLTAFAILELGAIFWVVGKRGLLVPR